MISRDRIIKAILYANANISDSTFDFLQSQLLPFKLYSVEYGSRNGRTHLPQYANQLTITMGCDYQRELYQCFHQLICSLSELPKNITIIPFQPRNPEIFVDEKVMEILESIELIPVPSFDTDANIKTLSASVKNITVEKISAMIMGLDEYDVLTRLGTFCDHPSNAENNNFISFFEFKTMIKEKYRPPLKICAECGFSSIQVDLTAENDIYKCRFSCE